MANTKKFEELRKRIYESKYGGLDNNKQEIKFGTIDSNPEKEEVEADFKRQLFFRFKPSEISFSSRNVGLVANIRFKTGEKEEAS